MKRFCLALDLIDDKEKIEKYKEYHKKIWPEIAQNIILRGIIDMQIWQVENRLFMIMETNDDYNPNISSKIANNNQKNKEWEDLMSQFQQVLPSAKKGEKWIEMEKIFDLQMQF